MAASTTTTIPQLWFAISTHAFGMVFVITEASFLENGRKSNQILNK